MIEKAVAAANRKDYSLLIGLRSKIDQFESVSELMKLGAAFKGFGFISAARLAYQQVLILNPGDINAMAMLASIYQDLGEHDRSYQLYQLLLSKLPDNTVLRSNYLLSQQWHPEISPFEMKCSAKEWGDWLISKVGERPRPFLPSLESRKLRVGYVSADFCQHTVGLLVKNVICSHSDAVQVYCYSATRVDDWVGKELSEATNFKDIKSLTDSQLAQVIISDGIDVLVDLSGHTAGTRISVFAYRPAPVLLSWLGYFATTGLKYIDGILLDKWHAPKNSDKDYVEPIIQLEVGRITYAPVPWMPSNVPELPCLTNGFITFGCFNNTNKLNDEVFDAWARILNQVHDSKLILKWRTFNDDVFRDKIVEEFRVRGITKERIECRGPSFHKGLLEEYRDVDIALDPFPFSGGLTSLEALYMGRPVITLPKSTAVSRQTHAFLNAINESKLSATGLEEYIEIATKLSLDFEMLQKISLSLRQKMQTSSLMSQSQQAQELEDVYFRVYKSLQ